jgi:hypothetical protein
MTADLLVFPQILAAKINSHSGKANEDVGAPAELGYPSSN